MQNNIRQSGVRRFELKLGATQLTVLLGLVLGSMAGAFYLGFSSGRSVGYDHALAVTLANAARVPIPVDERDGELGDDVTSEVYAKLAAPVANHERAADLPQQGNKKGSDDTVPQLGAIPSADELPILPEEALPLGGIENPAKVSQKLSSLGDASLAAKTQAQETTANVAAHSNLPTNNKVAPVNKILDLGVAQKEKESIEKLSASTKPTSSKVTAVEVKEAVPAKIAEQDKEKLTKVETPKKVAQGWYVQVAAPKKRSEAEAVASRLKKEGYQVQIETAEVKGEEYHRIILGPNKDRASAEQLVTKVKKVGAVSGEPFVRSVR